MENFVYLSFLASNQGKKISIDKSNPDSVKFESDDELCVCQKLSNGNIQYSFLISKNNK